MPVRRGRAGARHTDGVPVTLYRNGAVYTPADPFATALVVDGETVAWVGSDDTAATFSDDVDEVVDLQGGLVAPAFVDAHVHVTETGLALGGVDLSATRTLTEALDLVAAAARRAPGQRVLGHGWDERLWPEQRPPSLAELDRAASGAEVYLSRVDVHSAVVSSALAHRGGLADLPGWDDGRVERDAHHRARDLTRDLSAAERRAAQERALRAAAAAGVGAVHECAAPHIGSPEDLQALLALTDGGGYPVVVPYWGQAVADDESLRAVLDALGAEVGPRVAGLAGDLCVDGSVGSRTSAFREPYADAVAAGLPADHRGHLYLTAEEVAAHLVATTRAGLQGGFHVIGDAAVDAVLEGAARAAEQVGLEALRGARHRLEHVEAVDDAAVAALARLGLTASVQPAFEAFWGGSNGMYAERLGAERGTRLNRFGSLAAAGVPLALGSDSPVTPFDPWSSIRACAFHSDPEERISARAAFLAATRGGWRAARRDGEGVLVPGGPATLAVWEPAELVVQAPDERVQAWSTDPRSGTQGLPDLTPGVTLPRCRRTVVAGAVVHDAL